MAIIQVFDGTTDNGNSTVISVKPGAQFVARVQVDGTFDSGVLKLQFNSEATNGTWVDADTQTVSANGFIDVPVYGAKRLRVNLASVAGASADLDCFVTVPDDALDITQTDA